MFKTKSAQSLPAFVQEKLSHSYEPRPFPRVVVKLLAALKNPDVSPDEIAHIIESDAALSAKILRMANSPVCGFSNVIRTIEQATVVLGLTRLKSLAQTFAAAALFAGNDDLAMLRKTVWNHSLASATTARLIATRIKTVNPDEAFLAGIFHDVGQLFFLDVIPEAYAELLTVSNGRALVEQEQESFGISHQEAGVKLATAWQLPEPVMVAIGFHHQPENAIAHIELTSVVNLANGLVRAVGIGSEADPAINVDDFVRDGLKLSDIDFAEIQEQATVDFAAVALAYGS